MCFSNLTQEQITMMEGLRTFPPVEATKPIKPQTPTQIFKQNCREDYVEPIIEGWKQVEAPYGGVYAVGRLLTKEFRLNFGDRPNDPQNTLPKRHHLTLESAIAFADKWECCEAITKTISGYELRTTRCAIKNGGGMKRFNTGLRTWLRKKPFGDQSFYGKTKTELFRTDAFTLVDGTGASREAKAREVHKQNDWASGDWREKMNEVFGSDSDGDEPEPEPQPKPVPAPRKKIMIKKKPTPEPEPEPVKLLNVVHEYKWEFFKILEKNEIQLTELEMKWWDANMDMLENDEGEPAEHFTDGNEFYELDYDFMDFVVNELKELTEIGEGFVRGIVIDEDNSPEMKYISWKGN